MMRNVLYSLLLHLVLIVVVYFNFNFTPLIEVKNTSKVAVSFVVKPKEDPIKNYDVPLPPDLELEIPEEIEVLKTPEIKPIVKKDPPKKKEIIKKQALQKPIQPKPKPTKKVIKELSKQLEKPKKNLEKEVSKIDKNLIVEKKEYNKEKEQQPSFVENNISDLNLLVREKFNIQTQIKRCYKKSLKENGNIKINVAAHISIAKDGSIDLEAVLFKDFSQYKFLVSKSDKTAEERNFVREYKRAMNIVKKALGFCSPMKNLPLNKYKVWKEIDLQFN